MKPASEVHRDQTVNAVQTDPLDPPVNAEVPENKVHADKMDNRVNPDNVDPLDQ